MQEIWKAIPGYEGYYEASTLGRIRSLDIVGGGGFGGRRRYKGKVRKLCNMPNGYLHIAIYKNGAMQRQYVHRLIAQTFLPIDFTRGYVNHKNGIKADNRIENLEWCNSFENMQHAVKSGLMNPARGERAGKAVLTEAEAQRIKDLCKTNSTQAVLDILGMPKSKRHLVANIACGRIWKHLAA